SPIKINCDVMRFGFNSLQISLQFLYCPAAVVLIDKMKVLDAAGTLQILCDQHGFSCRHFFRNENHFLAFGNLIGPLYMDFQTKPPIPSCSAFALKLYLPG